MSWGAQFKSVQEKQQPTNPPQPKTPPPSRPNNNTPRSDQDIQIQRLRQEVDRLKLLMDISRQFTATLDFKKLLNTIFEKLLNVVNAEAGSFWLVEAQTQEVVCNTAGGPAKDQVIGVRMKLGNGIVGWVAQNKQPTVILDASQDERFSKAVDDKTNLVTKSMLSVPLVVDNECLGVIQLINKKTQVGQFSEQDVETLEVLASSGAVAIKNARLYQSEQRIKELNTLLNISKELSSTLDLDRVLLSVVNLGATIISYKRALIGLAESNSKVVIAAESNQAMPDLKSEQNQKLQAIMDYVMSTGQSLHINQFNAEKPPQNIPELIVNYLKDYELKCLSVIVLTDSEGTVGVLSMEGEYGSLVQAQSFYIINMIVNSATVALRNAQLYQDIPTTHIAQSFKEKFTFDKEKLRKWAVWAFVGVCALFAAIVLPVPSHTVVSVEIVPKHKTQVASIQSGRVQSIDFEEGAYVEKGAVLLTLDTTILDIEKQKLLNDRQAQLSELRAAESEGNTPLAYLKRLELSKIQSQLQLLETKKQHSEVTAPYSGRILTQNPQELMDKQIVEGEVLVEIAVEDAKQAHVWIDPASILKVQAPSEVVFSLQALPEYSIDGQLEAITPTPQEQEEAGEVKNYYVGYVQSSTLNETSQAKFGMTGKAKVHGGEQTLYEIFVKDSLAQGFAHLRMLFL